MNSSPPWDLPEPFLLHLQVTAAHEDALGHTNNGVYVQWCEQVAWAHSEALGLGIEEYRTLDRAMVITHSEYTYLQASHAGDTVQIGTWIVSCDGRLNLARRFQVWRVDDGSTLLRARMRFACVELSSGRPRRMPPAFLSAYGAAVRSDAGNS